VYVSRTLLSFMNIINNIYVARIFIFEVLGWFVIMYLYMLWYAFECHDDAN